MQVQVRGQSGPVVGQYEAYYTRTGQTLYYASIGATSTLAPSNNQVRACPLFISKACTIDRIGVEVTIIGQVGSVVRLGIYSDDGNGYPAALLGDYGTVAGDAVASPEIAISQAMTPGLWWLAACAQNAATTQPTLRSISGVIPPLSLGATSAATSAGAWTNAGVAGALPANFVAGGTPVAAVRVFVRVT